jgi:hypothetical protein
MGTIITMIYSSERGAPGDWRPTDDNEPFGRKRLSDTGAAAA